MENQTCSVNCDCESAPVDFYDFLERKLMGMTFYAHKEVLFEKIKQKIEAEEGDKLDKIASLLVEASEDKWKNEQEEQKKRDELREKLKETFKE